MIVKRHYPCSMSLSFFYLQCSCDRKCILTSPEEDNIIPPLCFWGSGSWEEGSARVELARRQDSPPLGCFIPLTSHSTPEYTDLYLNAHAESGIFHSMHTDIITAVLHFERGEQVFKHSEDSDLYLICSLLKVLGSFSLSGSVPKSELTCCLLPT